MIYIMSYLIEVGICQLNYLAFGIHITRWTARMKKYVMVHHVHCIALDWLLWLQRRRR